MVAVDPIITTRKSANNTTVYHLVAFGVLYQTFPFYLRASLFPDYKVIMHWWVFLLLLPTCTYSHNLFHNIIPEGCSFDRETSKYQCIKIRKQFPNMYYGDYRLNCMHCELKIFDEKTFPHKNALLVFNVTNSGMQNITSFSFQHLKNLQHIHLEHNQIRNVSENAFNGLRHVYELHLEHNRIENLTEGFLNGFEANTIYLNNNKIREVPPGVFRGLHGVMSLDLSYNHLNTLDKDSFYDLNGIEMLNLQHNQLCSLPHGAFKHIKTLRDLNLANNKFKKFPIGLFSPLKSVLILNISHNYLDDFDTNTLLPLKWLSKLDISGNGLEYLDTVTLHKNVPTVRHLAINDNLWTCPNLANAIQHLKSVNVDVSEHSSERYDMMNIHGIACSNFAVAEKMKVDKFLEHVVQYSAQYYC